MYIISLLTMVFVVALLRLETIGLLESGYFALLVGSRAALGFLREILLLIGFVAVFSLWPPATDGLARKRPIWVFVVLLVSVLVPLIIKGIIITFLFIVSDSFLSELFFPMVNIIYLLPIKFAMLIILLVKCEAKTKKILIMYLIADVLILIDLLVLPRILLIDSVRERMMFWFENATAISAAISVISNLIIIIFTIIYAKQKYNEVKFPAADAKS